MINSLFKDRLPLRTRLIRALPGALLAGVLLATLTVFARWVTEDQPRPAIATVKTTIRHSQHKAPIVSANGTMARPQAGRGVAFVESGELDGIADVAFGQLDFTTGAAPGSTDETTFNQAADVAIYELTLQIFVADTVNNRVLGWDNAALYASGDPATIVLGQQDYVSTDAPNPPDAASMNGPTGVAMGADGILYVADTGNHRVLVFMPYNICEYYEVIDNFYCFEGHEFSEYYTPIFVDGMDADYALGQPDLNSNTLWPTGLTTLNHPAGLVVDYHDNLVVADRDNNRVLIYEWPLADGKQASWVVGQGEEIGFERRSVAPNPPTNWSMNKPSAVARNPIGDELYVADSGNHRILIFTSNPLDAIADAVIGQPDFTSNSPNTSRNTSPNTSGVSATSLNNPQGLKMDAGSRLYVADTDNHRVLVFDRNNPDASADTVIGQPDFTSNAPNNGGISAQSLHSPRGLATDAIFMDIYVADQGNNRVLRYLQPLTNPLPVIEELDPGTVEAGTAGFTLNIWGSGFLVFDSVVTVNGVTRTVGSDYLGLIRIPISATEVVTTGQLTISMRNPAPGGGQSEPMALTVYEPQAADALPDTVLGQRGFTTDDGPFAPTKANTLFGPTGMVIDPQSGRLFVADMENARVLSWSSSAARTNGGSADLVFGKPDFETYFYDAAPGLNLVKPTGLALDSQGNLYVSDAEGNYVVAYRQPFTNGMAADLVFGWVDNPLDLLLDHDDNLYVADTFHHRVLFYEKPLAGGDTIPDKIFGQVDLNTTEANAGGAIGANTLHYPSGLAMDSAGNLYVADSNNHRVLVFFDPLKNDTTADLLFGQQGDFTTGVMNKGGVSAMSLNYPMGLALDDQGALYVADSDNHRILRFDNPLHTDQIADLVYGQGGSFTQNQPNHGQLTRQAGGRLDRTGLDQPTGVGITADGDLVITDYGNNRVLNLWAGGNAPAATPTITPTPTTTPTVNPSVTPTTTPMVNPSVTPTATPMVNPSVTPTATPTVNPSVTPTVNQTATPTVNPSVTPAATQTPPVPTATPDLTNEDSSTIYLPFVTK
jgi:hypothetical protein